MKLLGIIGGLSWVSTQRYYAYINRAFQAKYGGESSAPLLMASVNFELVVRAQLRGDWDTACGILVDAARSLKRGGADTFLIASNTMHLAYERICQEVELPGISIFDAIASEIRRTTPTINRVGLLGTRYAMNMPFFVDEYRKRSIEIVLPDAQTKKRVNEIIFKELIRDVIAEKSRQDLETMIDGFTDVAGVILGCTELEIAEPKTKAPLFLSSALHARYAANQILQFRG